MPSSLHKSRAVYLTPPQPREKPAWPPAKLAIHPDRSLVTSKSFRTSRHVMRITGTDDVD